MNKHMKLVVSLLFIVIIFLAVAITRFYSDTTKTTTGSSTHADIDKKYGKDALGNRLFENSAGLYGLLDSSDRIIIAPEWFDLTFTDNSRCIAKSKINGRILSGCVDYEGNIIVPLIYSRIERHEADGFVFFAANTERDDSWVIYDQNFKPCFLEAWSGCRYENGQLALSDDSGEYRYTVGRNGMALTWASVSGSALDCGYTINSASKTLLSKLDPAMLRAISDAAGRYLEYAFTGDTDCLADINASGAFSMLMPDNKRVISRTLKGIENIFIYSSTAPNGEKRFDVSVTASAEIKYIVSGNKTAVRNDNYIATIEFSGSSATDLIALSGSFDSVELDVSDNAEDKSDDKKKPEKPAENEENKDSEESEDKNKNENL